MSLLMDALKRAERARGGPQAEDGDDSTGLSETQGLALDPLEFSPPSEADDDLDLTGEHEAVPSPEDLMSDLARDLPELEASAPPPPPSEEEEAGGLSLEPRPDIDNTGMFELSQPAASDDEFPPPSGVDRSMEDSSPSMSLLGPEDGISEDTSATLPSVKSAQASVDSYFDGTRSISIPLGEVRGNLDDDTFTTEREVFDTGRQRSAANSVLQANRARRSGTNWTAVAVLPLLILAIVSGAGYVYWDTLIDIFGEGTSIATEQARIASTAIRRTEPEVQVQPAPAQPVVAPSQPAATGVTATAPAQQVAAAPAQPVQVAPTAPVASTAQETVQAAAAQTAATPAPASAPARSSQPESQAPTSGSFSAAPSVAEVMQPATPVPAAPSSAAPAAAAPVPSSSEAVLGTPDPSVMQRLAEAVEGPDFSQGGGPIRITRKSAPAKVHPLINRGYQALQSGDLRRAQRAYREILRAQPRNRDALLGLAAVAVQSQDFAAAQGLYLRVLEFNPRDTQAQAAVISLQNNVDPVQGEAVIKSLLRREPKDAFLHFSLGNLFAEQGRWPEAQQAYFDAHRLDSENADYVFNLAVALDQLVQPSTALDFYRRALELADDGYATFQPEMVLARIQTLSTGRQ